MNNAEIHALNSHSLPPPGPVGAAARRRRDARPAGDTPCGATAVRPSRLAWHALRPLALGELRRQALQPRLRSAVADLALRAACWSGSAPAQPLSRRPPPLLAAARPRPLARPAPRARCSRGCCCRLRRKTAAAQPLPAHGSVLLRALPLQPPRRRAPPRRARPGRRPARPRSAASAGWSLPPRGIPSRNALPGFQTVAPQLSSHRRESRAPAPEPRLRSASPPSGAPAAPTPPPL